jgi:hypothetical protein
MAEWLICILDEAGVAAMGATFIPLMGSEIRVDTILVPAAIPTARTDFGLD